MAREHHGWYTSEYKMEVVQKYLRQSLLRPTDNDTNRLDFYFADFKSKATKLLDEYRLNDYITLIKNFSSQYVMSEIPSLDNILTFIKVIFPIMPYLSEEVYEKKFKSRYSIINEGWPDEQKVKSK